MQGDTHLTSYNFLVLTKNVQALIVLYPAGDGSRPVHDVESIVALCTRYLESADQITRASLSRLVAHMLASTQVPKVIPVSDSSKKAKKPEDQKDEDEVTPPSGPAEVQFVMSPNEVLMQLANQYNKPQAPHKTRIGIFSFYVHLFTHLGTTFVEQHYSLIVKHLLNDIVGHTRLNVSRYDTLLTRSLVNILLRDLIGVRMLSEQGQIGAINELCTGYLRRWPAMMPGQVAPDSHVLTIVLQEIAGLLQQLGNAPLPVQVGVVFVSIFSMFRAYFYRICCWILCYLCWSIQAILFASTPPGLYVVFASPLLFAFRKRSWGCSKCCNMI